MNLLLTQAEGCGAGHLSDADQQSRGARQSAGTLSLQDTQFHEFYKSTNVAGPFFMEISCPTLKNKSHQASSDSLEESISDVYTAGTSLAT